MQTENKKKKKKGGHISLGIVNPEPLRKSTGFELYSTNFHEKFPSNPLSCDGSDRFGSTIQENSSLYVHAECTCKILKHKAKERGRLQVYNNSRTKQMLLLWLQKTMLSPTCTISSLLILNITVRWTRWSVGRGVLRVVTQAYQGDEETRLTEPRYCWPTTYIVTPRLLSCTLILGSADMIILSFGFCWESKVGVNGSYLTAWEICFFP